MAIVIVAAKQPEALSSRQQTSLNGAFGHDNVVSYWPMYQGASTA